MDKQYIGGKVLELENQINGLVRKIDNLAENVSMLSASLNTKVNKEDVQLMIERSELIKRINESESIGMDSMVRVELDGRMIAESIVEQTTDDIKMTVTDIKGVR